MCPAPIRMTDFQNMAGTALGMLDDVFSGLSGYWPAFIALVVVMLGCLLVRKMVR